MVITIDGPTASGKSSAAQLIARKFSWYYLNSGLLYRSIAYLLMTNKGYTLEQLKNPRDIDLEIFLDQAKLIYKQDATGNPHIVFDNRDITECLKNSKIDQAASIVSADQKVRDKLLIFQRQLAQLHNLVTDGRDMGTVVFPHADFKFFLTASIDARAARWMHDQQLSGNKVSIDKAIFEINMRDDRDSKRFIAPLKVPDDAIIIDNSSMSVAETVDVMVKYVLSDASLK